MANKNFRVRHGLTVSGDSNFSGILQVSGNTSVGGVLRVEGGTRLNGILQVSGNTCIGGTLKSTGDFQAKANLSVGSQITASGNVYAGQQLRAGGSLSVAGGVIAKQGLQVSSNASVGGNVYAGQQLRAGGSVSVAGGVIAKQGLQVSGSASIGGQIQGGGNVYAAQQLRAGGSVSVAGGVIAKQGLQVSGAASVGTLTVTGDTILSGALQVSGLVSVGGGFKVGGTASLHSHVDIEGTLQVSGGTSLGAGLYVSGVICSSGNIIAGDIGSGKVALTHNDGHGNANVTFNHFGGIPDANGNAARIETNVDSTASSSITLEVRSGVSAGVAVTLSTAATFFSNRTEINGELQAKSGLHVSGSGTIAGQTWANGHLRLGTAEAGIAMDPNEIYFSGAGNIGTLSGNLALNPDGQITAGSKTMVLGTLDANTLQVSGSASIGGNITICGLLRNGASTICASGISASNMRTQHMQVSGFLSVGGESNFLSKLSANTISASGQVIVDQQVQADGSGLFGQTVRAGSNLCGQGNCIINGTTTLRQTLDVSGNIQASGVLSGTQIRGTSLSITTIDAAGAVQSAGTVSGNNLHSAGWLQVSGAASVGSLKVAGALCAQGQLLVNQNFRVTGTADINSSMGVNGTISATSVYSSGQVRAAGALSCAGTGHFAQGVQICGTVSCTALHATGGNIQTTGAISGNPVRSGGQLCTALQIFANQTVVARKNLHVSGTACIGGTTKLVGSVAVCGKLTGTQISCHRIISQSGNVNSGGADYAEYFEWADGNPNVSDRIGRSVAITGPSGKIGIATAGQTPFGVITGRPGFIGNAAHGEWTHKWSRDDYFRLQRDENGEKILNPEWNSACTYINRESRSEWAKVGLLGKLAIRVGEPINPNWTKLRVITATIEEYLVR